MHKRFTSSAAALALAGSAVLLATGSASAATVTGKLLEYPVPGDLATIGGVAGWVQTNAGVSPADIQAWLQAQGLSRGGDGVTNVYAGGSHHDPHIQASVDTDTLTVEVEDCLVDNVSVGYVIADALGSLTVDANGNFSWDDPNGKADVVAQLTKDIKSLLAGVTATATIQVGGTVPLGPFNIPVNVAATVTLDLGTGLATFNSGNTTVDPLLNSFAGTLFQGAYTTAISGVIGPLLDQIPPLLFNQTVDLPYSFGYAYTDLTNDNQTVISTGDVMNDSWLKNLNQGPFTLPPSGIGSIQVAGQPLVNLLAGGISGAAGVALANAAVGTALQNAISGVIPQVQAALQSLIGSGAPTPISGTNLTYTITAPPSLSPGADAQIKTNLDTWVANGGLESMLQTILDNLRFGGSLTTSFTPGNIVSYQLSDVKITPKVHQLTADQNSLAMTVGDTKDVNAKVEEILAGLGYPKTASYTWSIAHPAVASVNGGSAGTTAKGTVTALAAGSSVLKIHAEVECVTANGRAFQPLDLEIPLTVMASRQLPLPPPSGTEPPSFSPPVGTLPVTGTNTPYGLAALMALAMLALGGMLRRHGRIAGLRHRA